MFEPDLQQEKAYRLSRFDPSHPLASCALQSIVLEEKEWLSCEHYYNAKIVSSATMAKKIEQADTGLRAYELAKPWYRKKQKGWQKMRLVLMTRALYTKVQMYEEVKNALLETGDQFIVETSLYDYYWGVGRDARGENQFGKIWMDIRKKVLQNAAGGA